MKNVKTDVLAEVGLRSAAYGECLCQNLSALLDVTRLCKLSRPIQAQVLSVRGRIMRYAE